MRIPQSKAGKFNISMGRKGTKREMYGYFLKLNIIVD